MSLKEKVAIVTGGSRDIGRAVSVKLASNGSKVVVNYRSSREDADQTLHEIEAVGGEAILVAGDMTQQEDVDRLVAETVAAFGERVDILVNVVGGLVARFAERSIVSGVVRQVVIVLVACGITYLIGELVGVNLGG